MRNPYDRRKGPTVASVIYVTIFWAIVSAAIFGIGVAILGGIVGGIIVGIFGGILGAFVGWYSVTHQS